MIHKLAWRPPSSQQLVRQGLDKFKEKDGRIVAVPEQQIDADQGFTFLEVREADLPDLPAALAWFTDQVNLPFGVRVSSENGVARIKIRGDFVPGLSMSAIAEMVADYRLLASRFGSWAEVVRRPRDTVQEAVEALLHAAAKALKACKDEPSLAWAMRVLEIRNELSRR
jgi:hypothetical protein